MIHSVGLLTVLAGIALGALSPEPQGQPPVTLRAALVRYGFDTAVGAADAPRLDAPLTSSEFGASPTAFAAAYYFRDELQGEGSGAPARQRVRQAEWPMEACAGRYESRWDPCWVFG